MVYFESKLLSPSLRILANICLAIIIFYNAEIGRQLGIQSAPLAISLVWPATGVSLAALLLFGYGVWPGIFLGNFCYNFYHLAQASNSLFPPFLAATGVTSGSTIEALVAAWIIFRYSSVYYFNTVKDVFIFLIPAGVLSCLIASTIGATSLYLYRQSNWEDFLSLWFTFWIGDTMGVYIMTPLLVVWSISKPIVSIFQNKLETFFIIAILIAVSALTFILRYPFWSLLIPISLWVTYRFRAHGATLFIFVISFTAIILTSFGYGAFAAGFPLNPLLMLVPFLLMIVVTSLLVAAIINERETAWFMLRDQNVDLQKAVESYIDEIRTMQGEVIHKAQFLTSFDLLNLGISRQIKAQIKVLATYTKTGIYTLSRIKESVTTYSERLDPKFVTDINDNLTILNDYMENTSLVEQQIDRIAKVMQTQAVFAGHEKREVFINPNSILNVALNTATNAITAEFPDFTFSIIKDYDKNAKMIKTLPEDISYAMIQFISYAIHSLKDKKDLLVSDYTPTLKLQTWDQEETIKISIYANGNGIPNQKLETFFHSFLSPNPVEVAKDPEEAATQVEMTLAHDIISFVLRGTVTVDSKEWEYLQFNITLPK